MKKILTIAAREYRAMVATKAFLVSILMMPILMTGGFFVTTFLNKTGGAKERKIVVWDGTGKLFDDLKTAADQANARLDDEPEDSQNSSNGGFNQKEKLFLEKAEFDEITGQDRIAISKKIENGEVYAFVEIPKSIMSRESIDAMIKKLTADANTTNPNKDASKEQETEITSPEVIFRSQNSALASAKRWFRAVLSQMYGRTVLSAAGINQDVVNVSSKGIPVKGLGLFQEGSESGEPEKEENELQAIFLPFGVMMFMFMVIFLAAQPALESVLEEKSQKIAEVLLGSANTFQLMIGKLIGVVGGSLTVFSIYITGIVIVAVNQNYDVPFEILPWFVVFQVLGVFFFGALFMAVGASVNQLKEAQAMLIPIWMLLMCPMFVWPILVGEPNGSVAVGMSLFPPSTPTTLMLRMATGQTVPMWQPIVGLVLMVASTLFVVHIAGRIFRVGILWQGKTPTMKEIFKWAFSTS